MTLLHPSLERPPLIPESEPRDGSPVCEFAMVGCVLWAGSALITHARIFRPEALALEFFGVSWLTKGRVVGTAGRVWRAIRR